MLLSNKCTSADIIIPLNDKKNGELTDNNQLTTESLFSQNNLEKTYKENFFFVRYLPGN